MATTSGRARALRVAKLAFLAVAVVLLVVALASRWDEFSAAIAGADPWRVIAAFAFVSLALLLNAMSWRAAMRGVGVAVPIPEAMRVFMISQMGKYVPGSVWPVVAQTEMAAERKVSRATTASGAVLAMIVGIATSGAVGAAALGATVGATAGPSSGGNPSQYWWAYVGAALAASALVPAVLRRVLALAYRVTRRSGEPPAVHGPALAASAGWSIAMWAAFGGHLWLILEAVDPAAGVSPLRATGAFALAWLAGFLVVLAPAGAGIREVALIGLLGGAVASGPALGIALISRVLATVADALAAAIALAAGGRAWLERARKGSADRTEGS